MGKTEQMDYIEKLIESETGDSDVRLFSAVLNDDSLEVKAIKVNSEEQALILCDAIAQAIYQIVGKREDNAKVALELVTHFLKSKFEEEGGDA